MRERARPRRRLHAVREIASMRLVRREGLTFVESGPVRGTLEGEMLLRLKLAGPGVVASFTVSRRDGTVTGRGSASLTTGRSLVEFSGTAEITGGTRAYRHAEGKNLRYTGSGAPDGSSATIRLSGFVRY